MLAAMGVGVGAVASLSAIGFVDAVAWLNDASLVSPRARVGLGDRP